MARVSATLLVLLLLLALVLSVCQGTSLDSEYTESRNIKIGVDSVEYRSFFVPPGTIRVRLTLFLTPPKKPAPDSLISETGTVLLRPRGFPARGLPDVTAIDLSIPDGAASVSHDVLWPVPGPWYLAVLGREHYGPNHRKDMAYPLGRVNIHSTYRRCRTAFASPDCRGIVHELVDAAAPVTARVPGDGPVVFVVETEAMVAQELVLTLHADQPQHVFAVLGQDRVPDMPVPTLEPMKLGAACRVDGLGCAVAGAGDGTDTGTIRIAFPRVQTRYYLAVQLRGRDAVAGTKVTAAAALTPCNRDTPACAAVMPLAVSLGAKANQRVLTAKPVALSPTLRLHHYTWHSLDTSAGSVTTVNITLPHSIAGYAYIRYAAVASADQYDVVIDLADVVNQVPAALPPSVLDEDDLPSDRRLVHVFHDLHFPQAGQWFLTLAATSITPATEAWILLRESGCGPRACSERGTCVWGGKNVTPEGLPFGACACSGRWTGQQCDEPAVSALIWYGDLVLLVVSNLFLVPAMTYLWQRSCRSEHEYVAEVLVMVLSTIWSVMFHVCADTCWGLSYHTWAFYDQYLAFATQASIGLYLGDYPAKVKLPLQMGASLLILTILSETSADMVFVVLLIIGVPVVALRAALYLRLPNLHWRLVAIAVPFATFGPLATTMQTNENYAMIHSVWHFGITVAASILVRAKPPDDPSYYVWTHHTQMQDVPIVGPWLYRWHHGAWFGFVQQQKQQHDLHRIGLLTDHQQVGSAVGAGSGGVNGGSSGIVAAGNAGELVSPGSGVCSDVDGNAPSSVVHRSAARQAAGLTFRSAAPVVDV